MKKTILLIWLLIGAALSAGAQETAEFRLVDEPNDPGKKVNIELIPHADTDSAAVFLISISVDGEFVEEKKIVNSGTLVRIPVITPGAGSVVDASLYAVTGEGERVLLRELSIVSRGEFIDTEMIKPFILALVFIGLIILYVRRAKRGMPIFIRKIPGLEAIDDALGRATEMGKPVFYIPGTSTMSDVATLASLNILRHVSKQVAKYETPFSVPVRDPIVVTVAQDVVKEAYMSAGRPDLYDDGIAYLAALGQFAYTGAVSGAMVREKPATVFLLGMFYAESLILAETANTIGAVQIAGTDASSQIPFFIAACDYTLIGEELYAASAYMSREPLLLGTLKAQDVLKGVLLAVFIVAVVLRMFGVDLFMEIFLNPSL